MSRSHLLVGVSLWFSIAIAALATLIAACGGYGGGGMGTPAPAPSVMISADLQTITLGQSATLTWSSTNASACTASGGWSGNQALSGTQTVTPTAVGSVTYTLSCTAPSGTYGGGGSAQGAATVTVNAASAFVFKDLVSDTGGAGVTLDPNLVNPWGIVIGPSRPVWVANNHTDTSTVYDGNGARIPTNSPIVVSLPGANGKSFDVTGIAFNNTTDFRVPNAGSMAPAAFIFVGEGGMIAGWAAIGAANAVNVYQDPNGAVYKGVTLADTGGHNFLYASDFHNGKVDVFDATFTKQAPTATQFAFADTALPQGYAPFGIQAVKNGAGGTWQIYVAYAMRAAGSDDETAGAGLGIVDVFDANGVLIKQLVKAGGALNAPWGIALAPADFGTLSNALLVGNFGDGKINGYDASTGRFLGAVTDSAGAPFAKPGLWGIAFGNDAMSQPHNTLFFAAGTNDEANGVYGRIDLHP